jgi:hypothetical protein
MDPPRQYQWGRTKSANADPVDLHKLTEALKKSLGIRSNQAKSTVTAEIEWEEYFEPLRNAFNIGLTDLSASLESGTLVSSRKNESSKHLFGFGGGLSGARFYVTADRKFVFKVSSAF